MIEIQGNNINHTCSFFQTKLILCENIVGVTVNNTNNNHNNNGKPNPDHVVLYLYTTYDSNSFRSISIASYPMMLVNPRQFYDGNDIEIAPVVKSQIFDPPRIFLKHQ